jgi:hypothetical protein
MAVRIDNNGDNLRRTANLPPSTGVTILGRAYRSTARGSDATIACLESASGADGVYLYVNNSNVLSLYGAANATAFASTPAVSAAFDWALTSNGSTLTGYYKLVGSSTWITASRGAQTFTPAQLTVGNDISTAWHDGRVWAVKVWDRVLTAPELLVESFYERPMYPASLNLWWPLHSHLDTADRSGNGRNATVGGTLTTEDSVGALWTPSRRIFLPAAAGGGSTPVPLSDSGAGSDAASIAASSARSDSGAGSGASGIAAVLTPSDSGAGSDGETTGLVISDSGAGSDAAALAAAAGLAGSAGGTESAAAAVTLAVADSGAGGDVAEVDAGSTPVALDDSATGSDDAALAATLDGAEAAAGDDQGTTEAAAALADSAAGSDGISVETGTADRDLDLADSAQGGSAIAVETFSDRVLGHGPYYERRNRFGFDLAFGSDQISVRRFIGAGIETRPAAAFVRLPPVPLQEPAAAPAERPVDEPPQQHTMADLARGRSALFVDVIPQTPLPYRLFPAASLVRSRPALIRSGATR